MFWDRVAWVYDVFANLINKKVHDALCREVASRIKASDDVLECACGTGLLSGAIAAQCRHLVATDFSEKMLRRARKKHRHLPNVEFRWGNILEIDFPRDRFDIVVAANVIHLLEEPHQALAEMSRVCRPNGTLIIPTYIRPRSGQSTATSEAADATATLEAADATATPEATTTTATTKNLSFFTRLVGKAGAGFQRQFTFETYQAFIKDFGYRDVTFVRIDGRIPCAVAVIRDPKAVV